MHKGNSALAVCEVCGLLWSSMIVAGTTYLVGWENWSALTWLGAVALLGCWTCSYCPGHAKYEQRKKESRSGE